MTPQETAAAMVGNYHQLLRQMKMFVNGDFNDYQRCAVQIALIDVKNSLLIFDGLHKPEYCSFDATGERKFTFEGEYENHMTGYDMISFFNEVELEIEKLKP